MYLVEGNGIISFPNKGVLNPPEKQAVVIKIFFPNLYGV
jgi:hypothetical protein